MLKAVVYHWRRWIIDFIGLISSSLRAEESLSLGCRNRHSSSQVPGSCHGADSPGARSVSYFTSYETGSVQRQQDCRSAVFLALFPCVPWSRRTNIQHPQAINYPFALWDVSWLPTTLSEQLSSLRNRVPIPKPAHCCSEPGQSAGGKETKRMSWAHDEQTWKSGWSYFPFCRGVATREQFPAPGCCRSLKKWC